MTDLRRKRLEKVRRALLALHKALVDSERISYEQTMGPIQSPNHFLQLLMRDPWFVWLQPLSQLIVSMDEALDAKETANRRSGGSATERNQSSAGSLGKR
jgi:hypothetical protein